MTHVVTGCHRCGTTMMMMALEAGGLIVARDENPGRRRDNYELPPSAYRAGFPRQYEGMLIKVLGDDALRMAPRMSEEYMDEDGMIPMPHPDPYRCFHMLRNMDAACDSWLRYSGGKTQHPAALSGNAKLFQQDVLNGLIMRRDCTLFVMDFDKVVQEPQGAMNAIARSGMVPRDFDVDAAAAIIRTPEAVGAA